jgi:opacity protein-like surface antigen
MSKLVLTAPVLALATAATPAYAQTYDWTGFYVGVHGALVDSDADWDGTNISQTVDGGEGGFTVTQQNDPISESLGGSEFGLGGRIGFNFQAGAFVLGAEADATFFDLSDVAMSTTGGATYTVRTDVSDVETIRARAGVTFGSAMLFVTGGVAFSDLEHTLLATNVSEILVDGGEGGGGGSLSKTANLLIAGDNAPRWVLGGTSGGGDTIVTTTADLSDRADSGTGWTVGGGGELRMSQHISLTGTLLYVDFGSEDLADSEPPASVAATVDSTMVIGMLGFNFTF